jgi:tetratricopeptide (TPR) repeat protein
VDNLFKASHPTTMPKRVLLLFSCIVAFAASSNAQCIPDRNLAWKQVVEISDSASLSQSAKRTIFKQLLSQTANCPYKNDSVHVLLLQVTGETYFREKDFLNAAAWYHQSIDLLRAHPGKGMNARKLVNSYFWLSTMYDSLNNYPEKLNAINKSIDAALQLNYTSSYACIRSLYERVKYRFDIGDYYSCIKDAAMCEQLANNYYTTDAYEIWVKKSIASSSLGWHVKSLLQLKNYDAAATLLLNKPEEYKNAGLDNYLGVVYEQMAQVQLYRRDYEKAITYFEKALAYEQKSGYHLNYKQTLNNLGYEVYFQTFRDYDKALVSYKRALASNNTNASLQKDDLFETLNIYANMANVFVQKRQFDTAFVYFQRAFDQLKPGVDETGILQVAPDVMSEYKKIHYLASLVIDKADAYYNKFLAHRQSADIQHALRIYKTADRLLDRIKSAQLELESKLFWRSDSRRLYEHAIAASYDLKDAATAFYFFEKSRAVLLGDQLAEQHRMNAGDISKLAQVKKKLTQLQGRPANDSALFNAREEFDNLMASIRKHDPLFYQSLDTAYISLAEVRQSVLQEQQSLLEIFAGDTVIYSLLVTPRETFFYQVNKTAFDNAVTRYTTYITSRDLLNRDFNGFRNVAHQLYTLIFPKGAPGGRMIISPEGRYFPFESLVAGNSGAQPVYFIEDHAVSYTYSARYLSNSFETAGNSTYQNLLGVAPVKYGASTQLPALMGSDLSLQKIASYIPGANNLTWQSASKNYFLKQFTGYKIIQLYTHASDKSHRNEPVIFFADSSLYLSDLMTENRPVTQLIILSACQTANGNVYQGEGVFSFSRGFAALGIPSSVSNLWSVDNLSTYTITEHFYKYLARGLPIDVALQKAKLEFLQTATGENKLPFYWAPAVLVGKTTAVEYRRKYPLVVYLLPTIVLILITAWYFRRQKLLSF